MSSLTSLGLGYVYIIGIALHRNKTSSRHWLYSGIYQRDRERDNKQYTPVIVGYGKKYSAEQQARNSGSNSLVSS